MALSIMYGCVSRMENVARGAQCCLQGKTCTKVYLLPLPAPLRGPPALNELAYPIRVANSHVDFATRSVP